MSDDITNPLEQEMMAMRPKAMPADILNRLTDQMATPRRRPWADYCLVGAMGSGVAAAFVIAAMLWVQSATDAPAPATDKSAMIAAGHPHRAGDYLAVYARIDGNWGAGIVK